MFVRLTLAVVVVVLLVAVTLVVGSIMFVMFDVCGCCWFLLLVFIGLLFSSFCCGVLFTYV